MADKPSVLLFGATGVIGRYLIFELVAARNSFRRLGVFTSAGTAEKKAKEIDKLKSQGVEVKIGDIEKEDDVLRGYEGENSD